MMRLEQLPTIDLQHHALRLAGERIKNLLDDTSDDDVSLRQGLDALQRHGEVRLLTLINRFSLSDIMVDVLLLTLAAELEPGVAAAIASHPLSLNSRATPAMAEHLLGIDVVDTLAASGTLRVAELVHLHPGFGFKQRTLSVPESVVQYVHGVILPDDQLVSALLVVDAQEIPDNQLTDAVVKAQSAPHQPVLFLNDDDARRAEGLARASFNALGLHALTFDPRGVELALPALAARINRDLILLSGGLVMPVHAESCFIADRIHAPVILYGSTPPELLRPIATYTPEYHSRFGDMALSEQNKMNAKVTVALGLASSQFAAEQRLAATGLEQLAERVEPQACWEDLVLPDAQREQLRQILGFYRHRDCVLDRWGFRGKSARGLGMAALFCGPSGTGKTMAAEIVAKALGPDSDSLALYRVDLSSMMSKYVGETQKNIARIFDCAEGSGSVLVFDEGESLFSSRTKDVSSSLDRHANSETAYLLQRLESYTGICIVTTNLKCTIDEAFLRRFRTIVDFPFPTAVHRARIWRSVFPEQAPLENLDFEVLGKLSVSGGFIRSIALNSAWLAAEDQTGICMRHVERAAIQEYAKLGKSLSETELRGFR